VRCKVKDGQQQTLHKPVFALKLAHQAFLHKEPVQQSLTFWQTQWALLKRSAAMRLGLLNVKLTVWLITDLSQSTQTTLLQALPPN